MLPPETTHRCCLHHCGAVAPPPALGRPADHAPQLPASLRRCGSAAGTAAASRPLRHRWQPKLVLALRLRLPRWHLRQLSVLQGTAGAAQHVLGV